MPRQSSAELAAAIQTPVRQRLDASVPRRVLQIDMLAAGASAYYDADQESQVVIANADNIVGPQRVRGHRAMLQDIEVATTLQIPISQYQNMTLTQLEDRIQNNAQQNLVAQENEMFFRLLDFSRELCENESFTAYNQDEFKYNFSRMFAAIEKFDLQPSSLICNNKKVNQFADLMTNAARRLEIISCDLCDRDTFYILPEPQYLGVLAIRSDLTCIPADDPAHLMIGWVFFENIGMAILHPSCFVRCNYTLSFEQEDTNRRFKNKYDYFNKMWKNEDEVTFA